MTTNEERKIWTISNKDKRKIFIEMHNKGEKFTCQKTGGKDVESFKTETGFVLLRGDQRLNPNSLRSKRVKTIAELSNEPKSVIRDQYYDLRSRPDLVEPFLSTNNVYGEFLETINYFEVICDVEREIFTSGLSKGIVFYSHRKPLNNPRMLISFTEDLAEKTLTLDDFRNASVIIVNEKLSSVIPMVGPEAGMGNGLFSKLTNTAIVTCGGQYNRAIKKLIKRFKDKKRIFLFADGDVYGQYMNLTVAIGTKKSRHLDDKIQHKNVYDVGLFPSVGKHLGLANDLEEKRPLESKESRDRIKLLEECGYSSEETAVFKENLTYEIQAINAKFKNNKQRKIGQEIYLLECMRLLNIPCKPQPSPRDEDLITVLETIAEETLKKSIEETIEEKDPITEVVTEIVEEVNPIIDNIKREIFNRVKDYLEDAIQQSLSENIRKQLLKQYEKKPTRERYSFKELSKKLIRDIEIDINWDLEALKEELKEALERYTDNLPDFDEMVSFRINFDSIDDPGQLKDFYDIVLKKLGVNMRDAQKIRRALNGKLRP